MSLWVKKVFGRAVYFGLFCSMTSCVFDLEDGRNTPELPKEVLVPNSSPTPSSTPSNLPVFPTTQIESGPVSFVAGTQATFTFSSTISGATFECQLDSNSYTPCQSPFTFTQAVGTGGAHVLKIRAISPDGTKEIAPQSWSWTQQNYQTISLFHFDLADSLLDASSFTGILKNTLLDSGTGLTSSVSGFSESRSLNSMSHIYTPHNDSHSLARENMAFEGFYNFTSLPPNYNFMVLASKSGLNGDYGWEFGVVRWGTNYYLYFVGSLDGVNRIEVESPMKIGSTVTLQTSRWFHLAFTWEYLSSKVTFYKDGVSYGNAILEIAPNGIPLFDSHADLNLGVSSYSEGAPNYPSAEVGGTLKYFNGSMDEIRWSQLVRVVSVPNAPFQAD